MSDLLLYGYCYYTRNLLGISVQAAHKKLKSLGWTCPKLGNKSYINHGIARTLFEFPINHPKVISAQIVKGGTGKTTTIDNVAKQSSLNIYNNSR